MQEIIPFKEQNISHAFKTNLLFKEDNIYVMDNHKMALWCWAQEIDIKNKYIIVHIDKHYDTLGNQVDLWVSSINKDLKEMSANEYNDLEYIHSPYEKYPIFRWDNYIPLFQHFYADNIDEYMFFTQRKGSIWGKMKDKIRHFTAFNLINDFPDYFEETKHNIIINLDIDYFFSNSVHRDIIFSDMVIRRLLRQINSIIVNKKNFMTIALSPECCGGWKNSIDFYNKYCDEFKLEKIESPATNSKS